MGEALFIAVLFPDPGKGNSGQTDGSKTSDQSRFIRRASGIVKMTKKICYFTIPRQI